MPNIHDYHGALPLEDFKKLDKNAGNQEQIVFQIVRGNPSKAFAYFDIIDITGYDKDSAKRSLSNLSGSANHDRYKDACGRWPVIYDKDNRKPNPKSTTTCGTYKANPDYGNPPEQPVKPNTTQGDMFGAPKRRHQGVYSGAGA